LAFALFPPAEGKLEDVETGYHHDPELLSASDAHQSLEKISGAEVDLPVSADHHTRKLLPGHPTDRLREEALHVKALEVTQ